MTNGAVIMSAFFASAEEEQWLIAARCHDLHSAHFNCTKCIFHILMYLHINLIKNHQMGLALECVTQGGSLLIAAFLVCEREEVVTAIAFSVAITLALVKT